MAYVSLPPIRYARTPEGIHVAYQVVGDGPIDLVWAGPGFSNIEHLWGLPPVERFLRRLSQKLRLIMFDPRGMGLSDPLRDESAPTIESRMTDLIAVMDAAGSESAGLLGHDSTGPIAIVAAATHPHRVVGLVLYGTFASGRKAEDYPWAWTDDEWDSYTQGLEGEWGSREYARKQYAWLAPSIELDDAVIDRVASYFRAAASPGTAMALQDLERRTDVRAFLGSVHVPTIVMHRRDDHVYFVDEGRYLADHIPQARFIELEGVDHVVWHGDSEAVVIEIERFLTRLREREVELERVLATVLFTDIVASTSTAADIGDRHWKELLQRHHVMVRAMLDRFRGTEIDTAGDGFFATFDGPARAVRCAQAIIDAAEPLGLQIRAGIHTGEVEAIDGKVGGIAVSIGARVGALAGSSEVLVSQTVKDLVVGSGLAFEERGEHELRGVPDRWRLYSATPRSVG